MTSLNDRLRVFQAGEICEAKHNKIDAFVEEHAEEIGFLVTHFKEKCKPYETVQDLLVDMLDDVIDIWVDAHRRDDSCLYDEVGAVREITIHNVAIDDFRECKNFGNLEDTREYCSKVLGIHFDISEQLGYAISGDGINRLTVEGATWQELFPNHFD